MEKKLHQAEQSSSEVERIASIPPPVNIPSDSLATIFSP